MAELPEFAADDTLAVVDVSGFVHRFFHGSKGRNERSPGEMFAAMVGGLLTNHAPARLALAEDNAAPTFRHALAPGVYKAERRSSTSQGGYDREAVVEELGLATHLCRQQFGVRSFTVPGFEADDIVATLATWGLEEGLRVVVLGFDKDLMQLVNGSTTMWNAKEDVTGPAEVVEKLGVKPEQVVDYLSITGDKSDNVPGVFGVGPVNAAKVLEAFGTINAALDSAEGGLGAHPFWKANPRVWSRLAGGRPSVDLAKRLVRLRFDVPLDLTDLDALRVGP